MQKGEVVNIYQTNLVDLNGHYQSNVPVMGTLGGHLMQIYYVLEEILKRYPNGLKNYMEKKI
jgi:hypothetical protein